MTDEGWGASLAQLAAARSRTLGRTIAFFNRRYWISILGILVLTGYLAADKGPILLQNAAPSGADPGNWLSLAWGITGQSARLAAWAYPPLAFILLRGLLLLFPPLVALKILGFAVWSTLAAAFWIVLLRYTPRLPALLRLSLAMVFAFAGYNNEIFAWGGYPQLLGMAFLLLAIPSLEEYLSAGERRPAGMAAGFSAAVIYTHQMLAAALLIFWVIVFAWKWIQNPSERRILIRRGVTVGGLTAALSMLAIPFYWRYFSLLAGNPANSSGYNPGNLPVMIRYVFRDLAPLWLAMLFLAMVAPFLLRRTAISGTVLAFTWGTILVFFAVWEVRLLQVLFAGIGLGLAILFEHAWGHPSFAWFTRLRRGLLIVSLALVLLSILDQGHQQYIEASAYYRVVDNDLIPGLDWLKGHTHPQDRVAVSRTQPDLIGWWVEGYAGRPSFYAADLRWLSFRSEQEHTAIANQIFDPTTPAEKIGELLLANQVRWVFLVKNLGQNNLSPLIEKGFLTSAFENNHVLILKVSQQAGARMALVLGPPGSPH